MTAIEFSKLVEKASLKELNSRLKLKLPADPKIHEWEDIPNISNYFFPWEEKKLRFFLYVDERPFFEGQDVKETLCMAIGIQVEDLCEHELRCVIPIDTIANLTEKDASELAQGGIDALLRQLSV